MSFRCSPICSERTIDGKGFAFSRLVLRVRTLPSFPLNLSTILTSPGSPHWSSSALPFIVYDPQDKKLPPLGAELEGFGHIRYLDLSKNALTAIPCFRALTSLLSVIVDENDLTELPPLAELPHLQVVVANNNLISTLAGVKSDSLIQLSVNGERDRAVDRRVPVWCLLV